MIFWLLVKFIEKRNNDNLFGFHYSQINKIRVGGAKYIAEALKCNNTLTTVHLEVRLIFLYFYFHFFFFFFFFFCLNEGHWPIQQLNKIGDEGAKYIAEALNNNTKLTILCLGVRFYLNKVTMMIETINIFPLTGQWNWRWRSKEHCESIEKQ